MSLRPVDYRMGPARKSFLLPPRPEWKRFCYPLLLVAVIRIFGALWLYHLLSAGGKFHTSWMDANPSLFLLGNTTSPIASSSWLWLFNAWDSPHFLLIATAGYSHPQYVFLPGYPIIIRVMGALLIGNYPLGAFVATQIFALASIVMFQLVAEQYMAPREAVYATMFMATFPYVFVFTTLGYSESLFLFATVSAWYFYKKEQLIASSLMAGIASITRIYGVAILVPVVLDLVRSRNYRRLTHVLFPIGLLGMWAAYCYIATGNPFVSWTDESYWVFDSKLGLVPTILSQILVGLKGCCTLDPGILVSVALFGYLIIMIWKLDRSLATYPLAVFIAILFVVITHLSILRFFSFLFPIWLTIRTRNPIIATLCIALFVPMSILLWYYAITLTFVG